MILFVSNLDVADFFMLFVKKSSMEEDPHEQIEGYKDIDYLDDPDEAIG